MLLVSVSDFRSNLSKYLRLAATELVSVKTKHGIFDIKPSTEVRTNPSPSGDPFWDVPENLAALDKAIEEAHKPDAKFTKWEDFKREMEEWMQE